MATQALSRPVGQAVPQAQLAAQAAWNDLSMKQVNMQIVDSALSGHIHTVIQNIPGLHGFLETYGTRFSPQRQINRAPIPVAQVQTYSHLFCPLIWRVLTLYNTLPAAQQRAGPINNMPPIPNAWLTYGNTATGTSNYRNVSQTTNPQFYGIGNQEQQAFWDTIVNEAANDRDFINALKMYIIPPHEGLQIGLIDYQEEIMKERESRSRQTRQAPRTTVSRITEDQLRAELGENAALLNSSNIQSIIRRTNGNRERALKLARNDIETLQQVLQQTVVQHDNVNANNAELQAALAQSMVEQGGKRNKRRQTKRKSRKQKRKSTYRRRR